MINKFFDSNGKLNEEYFLSYLETTTPEAIRGQLLNWSAHPSVVLYWADSAYKLDHYEHALVFYNYSLDMFEKNPSLNHANINLMGAYYFYGKTLLLLDRAAEAIRPLTIATTMDQHDAMSWRLLGHAYETTDPLGALRCFKKALSLKGVDKLQKPPFYETIRKFIAKIEEDLVQQQRGTSSSRTMTGVDYEVFKQELSRMGITGDRRWGSGFQLSVPCRKPGGTNVLSYGIAAIYKERGYIHVVSLTLPYFHGPAWRQITGGKPLDMQCHTWDEVLAYIMESFGERWQGDVLLVDEWQ